MERSESSIKLGEHIFRNLVDNYQITNQEAVGMAKWLLWLKLEGEYQCKKTYGATTATPAQQNLNLHHLTDAITYHAGKTQSANRTPAPCSQADITQATSINSKSAHSTTNTNHTSCQPPFLCGYSDTRPIAQQLRWQSNLLIRDWPQVRVLLALQVMHSDNLPKKAVLW